MSHRRSGEPLSAADALQEWFAMTRGVFVDVELAGVVFGGRSGEAPQCPRTYAFDGATLEMHFNTTEKLTVVRPSAIELGYSGRVRIRDVLIIPDAEEVRWGWHYYGRSETPENWCTETYQFDGDVVARRVAGAARDLVPDASFHRRGAAAVRLVPLVDRELLVRNSRKAASDPDPVVRHEAQAQLGLLGES